LRYSGIYEHWVRDSVNLKGFGPDIDVVPNESHDYNVLSLNQLRGVFYLMIFGIVSGVLLII
jgi:hypothetical protein